VNRSGVIAALVAAVVLSGCSVVGGDTSDASRDPEPRPTTTTAPTHDPDAALSWGPTVGELEQATAMVADWTPARLAGQVIVGRYHGTDPAAASDLVRDLHLAGVSMQSENVVDREQVRATTRAVADAAAGDGRPFPPVIGVDQEGGVVSHLRGVATEFPPYADAGDAIETHRAAGRAVVREAAEATGLELRDLGFTWVWAPVADVTIGYTDPTIGSRSPSEDPRVAAAATTAAVRGYARAGVASTTKHFPGHGAVTADSHEELPELDATLPEIRRRDLRPFRAAVDAGAPAVMMSHVDVRALAPGRPASLAEPVYDLLADGLGFEGVVITDSLGMGAVVGRDKPPVTALLAGADLLLMPVDTRRAHAMVTSAVRRGEVPRDRIEEAAAKVVALQLWQARVAAATDVPADATARAAAAAAALAEAGG
jgi:beta-N-acetylhexosaminidase